MNYKHHTKTIFTNKALLSLLLSNSAILISLGMLVPIYALFVEQVGGSALSAGLTGGALAFASAIAALLSGKIIDKVPHDKTRYFLVLGWSLIGASALLYLLVDNIAALFLVQILFGFVKTISSPAFDTLYARHLDKSSAGQEYGIWEASFFVTAGIGSVLGGLIVTQFGFDGIFISMSVLAFMAAAYIAALKKEVLA
jgi:DHA1 family multidrug resistance protein-like MFS transporter